MLIIELHIERWLVWVGLTMCVWLVGMGLFVWFGMVIIVWLIVELITAIFHFGLFSPH